MNEILEELNRTINIAKRNPFYDEIQQVSSISEFEELPTLEKEELLKLKPEDFVRGYEGHLYEYHETSGTEETPLATWFTKADFMGYVEQILESPINFNENDRILIRFPSALSVPAHTFTEVVHRRNGCVLHAGRSDRNCGYKRAITLLLKFKATILAGNVMEIFLLGYVAKKMGYDTKKDFSLRAICTAGEVLSEARRRRLEVLWGVPIYNFYGTTELGNLAVSDNDINLKVSDKNFYLEVLDEKNKRPVGFSKKGILHVTTLRKECFPLIRYNTKDIVSLWKKDGQMYIKHFGRQSDVVKIHNKVITMYDLQDIFLSLPTDVVGDFWKIMKHKNFIEIIAESPMYWKQNSIGINVDFPYKLTLVPEGRIVNIEGLMKEESYEKPTYYLK